MSAPPPPGDDRALAHSGTALFIRRPILAFVLNAMILLAGLAALFGANVRELPEVDTPVITVTTDFDGASPETIDQELTDRIEGAASRVPGVRSISSVSRFGQSRVTVEFNASVDLDAAASDMRDAVARIRNTLPDDAEEPRVVKADANSEAVMRVAVTSARRSPQELTQIVEDQVEARLLAAPGVADIQLYGDRAPVFRVDIDQMQLASRGLTLADLRRALETVAYDSPSGALSSERQSLVVRATATVTTPASFEALEIAPDVRLGDVARVTLGPDQNSSLLRANGENGVGLGVIRQAQSNTLEISDAVRAVVAALQKELPADVRIFVTSDDATFIRGSIHEVESALGLSVLIVVGIIYLFLRDARATLIPALAIPVALVGTLAAIWLVGFSINILTLLALVLATGLVVDDAIVVLENIVRRRAEGMGARAAAVLGTQQVFFAVVATTTTLVAVFVPLAFLPGQTGGLFREFGFALAISVLLSAVTALSLCPVLASRLLQAAEGTAGAPPSRGPSRGPVARLGAGLAALYHRTLHWSLDAPFVVLALALGFALTAAMLFGTIRQELTPPEDRSVILLSVSAPQGVALDYTDGKMREIEDVLQPLRAAGEVVNVFSIAGRGGSANAGFMVVSLAPWDQRARSQQVIAEDIGRGLRRVVGVRAFAIQPNSLGVRGAGQGLSFAVVGDSYERLSAAAGQLVERMEQNPGFGQVRLGYETTQPQLFIEVDRTRASDLGIDITGMGEALQAVLDGRTVATVFRDDDSYDIRMVSTADPVDDPGDLERIFVRAGDGQMIPVSSFVRLEERAVAPQLSREGQRRAVPVTAGLTPGMGLGEALAEVERLSAEMLPPDLHIKPLAEAATLGETSSGLGVTFGFAVLIVLLVLAAQFESFVSALIVMATVPLGLACAVVALVLTGGSLNVYSQIGLVLLVGIMAKNGILIVEFANQLRDEGAPVRRAIEEACAIRLRPVMMTMIATLLGGLPLVLAHGAGAEARTVLGWIIVGGLGMATLATLYLTPVAYLLCAGLSKPRAEEQGLLLRELHEATRPGTPAE